MSDFSSIMASFSDAHQIQSRIEEIFNSLVSSDFSPDKISSLKDFTEECLSSSQSKFLLPLLFDSAKNLAKVIKKNDKEKFSDFRKLIKTLLIINNEQVLSYFETNLLKEKNPDKFFIFLEENILSNRDISFMIDSFVQLIDFNFYNYISIKNFLKKISKDQKWLIHRLLCFELYTAVTNQIHETASNEKENLKQISEALASYPKYPKPAQYARLINYILQNTNEHLNILLNHPDISSHLLESVIISEQRVLAIKNYSIFLFENKGLECFLDFENKLLSNENLTPYSVLEYSKQVLFATRRSVLKKLISLKSENELVAFIKNFPEYKSLLMLL